MASRHAADASVQDFVGEANGRTFMSDGTSAPYADPDIIASQPAMPCRRMASSASWSSVSVGSLDRPIVVYRPSSDTITQRRSLCRSGRWRGVGLMALPCPTKEFVARGKPVKMCRSLDTLGGSIQCREAMKAASPRPCSPARPRARWPDYPRVAPQARSRRRGYGAPSEQCRARRGRRWRLSPPPAIQTRNSSCQTRC